MFSKDNIPQTVFNIKAEYADSRIQEIFQKFNPIPIKNSSFVNHQTLPFYEVMELEFSQKLNDTFKELSEKSIPVETINWSSSELANLTKVLEVLDIFVPQAGKNMNIYIMILVSLRSSGSIPMLGTTKDYCPVTLKKRNMLVKGESNITAKFLVI